MPVLFADDFPSDSTRLRRVGDGTIAIVARGIWTDQTDIDPEEVVAEHWRTIVARSMPGAVITGRTGFEHAPENGNLFVSHPRNRTLELPGLTVHPDGRDERRDDDIPLLNGLYGASIVRALIDNAETRGRPSDPPRRLTPTELADRAAHLAATLGPERTVALLHALDAEPNTVAAGITRDLITDAQNVPLFDLS